MAAALALVAMALRVPPAQATQGFNGYGGFDATGLLDKLGIPKDSSKGIGAILDEQINVDMGPAMTNLQYSFCNAQVCGTSENLECTGNLYIPGFTNQILQKLSLPPPMDGAKLLSFSMAHGPTTPTGWFSGRGGGGGAFPPFLGPLAGSTAGPNGVNFNFGLGPYAPALRPGGPLGDACGVPEKQRNDVTGKNPNGIENDYAKTIVKLQWQVSAIAYKNAVKAGTVTQPFNVNGQLHNFTFPASAPLQTKPSSRPTFSQSSSPAAGTGGVTMANMLSALGLESLTPTLINQFLTTNNLSTPSGFNLGGAVNPGVLSSLFGQQANPPALASVQTTLGELAKAFGAGQVVPGLASQLTGYSPQAAAGVIGWAGDGNIPGGAAVITGYDPSTDNFSLVNVLGQTVDVGFRPLSSFLTNYGQVFETAVRGPKL
jgi:hypothetical protein